MKGTLVRAASLVLVLVLAAGSWLAAPVAQSTSDDIDVYRYRGRVVDTSGGRVPGVEIACRNRKSVVRATTDARGEYALVSRDGTCKTVEFALQGFVTETFHWPGGDVLDVSLVLGGVGEVVGPTPQLPGTVVHADGSSAADASVWLRRLGAERVYGARSDRAGRFSMPLYEFAGDYALCARGAGTGDGSTCVAFTASEAFRKSQPRLQLPAPSR